MEEACPLTNPATGSEQDAVKAILCMKRIAVVGMSADPFKAGHYVPKSLQERGREIIPVNPSYDDIEGVKCYPSLADVPGPIDAVLVFRRPEHCGQVAKDAAAVKAKGLWLQSGIVSKEARETARQAGMWYVESRCMMVEAMRDR
jgi:predicted CoA-binding protein